MVFFIIIDYIVIIYYVEIQKYFKQEISSKAKTVCVLIKDIFEAPEVFTFISFFCN